MSNRAAIINAQIRQLETQARYIEEVVYFNLSEDAPNAKLRAKLEKVDELQDAINELVATLKAEGLAYTPEASTWNLKTPVAPKGRMHGIKSNPPKAGERVEPTLGNRGSTAWHPLPEHTPSEPLVLIPIPEINVRNVPRENKIAVVNLSYMIRKLHGVWEAKRVRSEEKIEENLNKLDSLPTTLLRSNARRIIGRAQATLDRLPEEYAEAHESYLTRLRAFGA